MSDQLPEVLVILNYLKDQNSSISPKEIVLALGIPSEDLEEILKELEAEAWILRYEDTKRVCITVEGSLALDRILKYREESDTP